MSDEQNTSTTPANDNSDNSTFEQQVSDALDSLDAKGEEDSSNIEPDTESGADVEKKEDDVPTGEEPKNDKDNADIQYPDKFKNEDGSLNTQNLLKSYLALEPLLNQKAAWEKEKAELLDKAKIADEIQAKQEAEAKSMGYQSMADMETMKEIVLATAQEYAKYVYQTDDPQHTWDLLNRYIANPTPELMEEIEVEYSSAVNKHVAITADRKRTELEQNALKVKQENIVNTVKSNIASTVEKHKDLFNVAPFKELYVKALQTYGDRFTPEDADVLVEFVGKLKDYYYKEFTNAQKQNSENNKELNSISKISPKASKTPIKNISDMSDDEFEKTIYDLV